MFSPFPLKNRFQGRCIPCREGSRLTSNFISPITIFKRVVETIWRTIIIRYACVTVENIALKKIYIYILGAH